MIKHSTVIRAPHWFSGKQPRLTYEDSIILNYQKLDNFFFVSEKIWKVQKCHKITIRLYLNAILAEPLKHINDGNQRIRHLRKHKSKSQEFQLCFLWHKKHEYVLQFALKWLFSAGSWDELAWQLWDCKRLLSRSGAAGLIKFLWSLKFFSTLPNKTKDFWH